jgi:polyphosphate kinase
MGLGLKPAKCAWWCGASRWLRRYVHEHGLTIRDSRIYGRVLPVIPLGADVADLFNALTGYSRQETYANSSRRDHAPALLVRSPGDRRQHQYGDGYLAFKMNALVTKPVSRRSTRRRRLA